MSNDAESSSQALERYIASQLQSLNLTVPNDDVEYMARFVEEEGMEREEKIEGVKGMLEGVVEGGALPDEGVDEALDRILQEWEKLKLEDEKREAANQASSSDGENPASPPPPQMTDKEIARLHALRYAYLEGEEPPVVDDPTGRGNAPPRGQAAMDAEAKKAAEERKAQIEAAIKLDGKKKKHKKNMEVDLLAPNLNKEKATYIAQMGREASKKDAQQKKDRDKAALEKQRADQAKAKADKQKKAAKQERRG